MYTNITKMVPVGGGSSSSPGVDSRIFFPLRSASLQEAAATRRRPYLGARLITRSHSAAIKQIQFRRGSLKSLSKRNVSIPATP